MLVLECLRYLLFADLKLYLSIFKSKPFPLRLGKILSKHCHRGLGSVPVLTARKLSPSSSSYPSSHSCSFSRTFIRWSFGTSGTISNSLLRLFDATPTLLGDATLRRDLATVKHGHETRHNWVGFSHGSANGRCPNLPAHPCVVAPDQQHHPR